MKNCIAKIRPRKLVKNTLMIIIGTVYMAVEIGGPVGIAYVFYLVFR